MMNIILIHGRAGSPEGSALQLEELLRAEFPMAAFSRPLLPHTDATVRAEDSLKALRQIEIPLHARIVGISLGGLLAARLQETFRPDLNVLALSSPTWADAIKLETRPANRVAVYSSSDVVLGGGTEGNRTVDWPRLAEAHDLAWLTHDTKAHKQRIAPLIARWLRGEKVN